MTNAFADIDRAAAECPARQLWTDDERELVRYGHGKVSVRTLLDILNNTNKAAGRQPRTIHALECFIARNATQTEGNGQ